MGLLVPRRLRWQPVTQVRCETVHRYGVHSRWTPHGWRRAWAWVRRVYVAPTHSQGRVRSGWCRRTTALCSAPASRSQKGMSPAWINKYYGSLFVPRPFLVFGPHGPHLYWRPGGSRGFGWWPRWTVGGRKYRTAWPGQLRATWFRLAQMVWTCYPLAFAQQ